MAKITDIDGNIVSDEISEADIVGWLDGKRAGVSWNRLDVIQAAERRGIKFSEDDADDWYSVFSEELQAAMVKAGWDFIFRQLDARVEAGATSGIDD